MSLDKQDNDMNEIDDPEQHFRELLLSKDAHGAESFARERLLPPEKMTPHIREVFDAFVDIKHFRDAIKIGTVFHLDTDEFHPLYTSEWKKLCDEKEYENAAKWAVEQGLTDLEINRSANLAFRQYINERKTEDALRVFSLYDLKAEELLQFTIAEFNRAFNEGDFLMAARLGKEFNFSFKRTSLSAIYAIEKVTKDEEFAQALDTIQEFGLLTDEVFGILQEVEAAQFTNILIEQIAEPLVLSGNLHLLERMIKENDIFERVFENHEFKKFEERLISAGIKGHNHQLREGKAETAFYIRDMFKQFASDIPFDQFMTTIAAAIQYHLEMLKKNKLQEAIKIKNEYMLFAKYTIESAENDTMTAAVEFVKRAIERADFVAARRAISEYKVPIEKVHEAMFKAVFALMNRFAFIEALKIIDDFELKALNEELAGNLIAIYHKLVAKKEYLLAAEFAKNVHLDKKKIEDAAYKAWYIFMTERKYDNAVEVFHKYKINKARTADYARRDYDKFIEVKDYSMAVYIRTTYKLNITLTEWISELIKRVFNK